MPPKLWSAITEVVERSRSQAIGGERGQEGSRTLDAQSEELNSNSQHSHSKLSMKVHSCNSHAGEPEAGGWQIPGAS